MVDPSRSFRPSHRGLSDADTGPIAGPIVASRISAFGCADTGLNTDLLPICISVLVHKRHRCIVSAAVHTSSSLIGVAYIPLCSARSHKEGA